MFIKETYNGMWNERTAEKLGKVQCSLHMVTENLFQHEILR